MAWLVPEGKGQPPKEFKHGIELISKINLVPVWDKFMGARLGPER